MLHCSRQKIRCGKEREVDEFLIVVKMYLFDTDFIINLVRVGKGAVRFAGKVNEEMAYLEVFSIYMLE